jgi:hypothetical protein
VFELDERGSDREVEKIAKYYVLELLCCPSLIYFPLLFVIVHPAVVVNLIKKTENWKCHE